MPKTKKNPAQTPSKEFVPELDPEARQAQLINLAELEAERRMRNGTASPQIIVHYLKLATLREKKEMEILGQQAKLIAAKTEAIESGRREEELYAQAIEAMKAYNGFGDYGGDYGDDENIF